MSASSDLKITHLAEPAGNVAAIAPSDSLLLINPTTSKAYVGKIRCSADCTLQITTRDGDTLPVAFFKGDNPIMVAKVWATGTVLGGASIWGLY